MDLSVPTEAPASAPQTLAILAELDSENTVSLFRYLSHALERQASPDAWGSQTYTGLRERTQLTLSWSSPQPRLPHGITLQGITSELQDLLYQTTGVAFAYPSDVSVDDLTRVSRKELSSRVVRRPGYSCTLSRNPDTPRELETLTVPLTDANRRRALCEPKLLGALGAARIIEVFRDYRSQGTSVTERTVIQQYQPGSYAAHYAVAAASGRVLPTEVLIRYGTLFTVFASQFHDDPASAKVTDRWLA